MLNLNKAHDNEQLLYNITIFYIHSLKINSTCKVYFKKKKKKIQINPLIINSSAVNNIKLLDYNLYFNIRVLTRKYLSHIACPMFIINLYVRRIFQKMQTNKLNSETKYKHIYRSYQECHQL